jgi:tRNA(fMet)-specific endonuclease VapC
VIVLLDTNVLSEPLRELHDAGVMVQLEKGEHALHTASVVTHELSYGLHRVPPGRKRQRLSSYLQGLLASGLAALPYDCQAALWHGEQRASLAFKGVQPALADGQIAAIAATQELVLGTRNTRDFAAFAGLQVVNWFSQP